jgi:hypothetical protein
MWWTLVGPAGRISLFVDALLLRRRRPRPAIDTELRASFFLGTNPLKTVIIIEALLRS